MSCLETNKELVVLLVLVKAKWNKKREMKTHFIMHVFYLLM